MSGWAFLIVSVFWAVLVAFLSFALLSLFRVLTSTRDLLEDFRRQTTPLLQELNETVGTVNKDLVQVEQILGSVRGTAAAVEGITKTTQAVVTHPAIRVLAVAAGAGRTWRKLRKGKNE